MATPGALRRGRSRRHDESGAAVVELALVLPVLVMLVFGIMTAGLAYSDHLAITNAAREGARLGSSTDYSSAPSAWATSVRDRVKQVYFNTGDTVTDSQICVKLKSAAATSLATWTGSDCGTEPGDPTGAFAGGTCVVKVWVRKPQKIEILLAPSMDFHIGAGSVSLYGREAGSCVIP